MDAGPSHSRREYVKRSFTNACLLSGLFFSSSGIVTGYM